MKHVLLSALFKAAYSLLILYVLMVGYQYVMWHRVKIQHDSELIPASCGVQVTRGEVEKALGIEPHFSPYFGPFWSP